MTGGCPRGKSLTKSAPQQAAQKFSPPARATGQDGRSYAINASLVPPFEEIE
jgi:hypothetical protein